MKTFIFGALIGCCVAMLYAPQTGKRTRSQIRDKAMGLGNDVSDFVQSKQKHIANKMQGYRAKMRSMGEQINGTVNV